MLAEPVEKHRSAHVITLTGYFIGLPVESVLRIAFRPPHAMEFKQVRGPIRRTKAKPGGMSPLQAALLIALLQRLVEIVLALPR